MRGNGQRPHGAALDLSKHRWQRREREIDAACNDLGRHRRCAAEGDVHHVGAGLGFEQFHREMRGRSGAGRSVVELAGLLFGQRHQLLHRRGGKVLAYHQRMLEVGNARDRAEIGHRIIAGLLEQDAVGRVRLVGAEHDGVPGRLGPCHLARPERARCAGLVLDHQGPPVCRLQLLRDDAGKGIRRPCRRVGHHQAYGLRRVGLRPSVERQGCGRRSGEHGTA